MKRQGSLGISGCLALLSLYSNSAFSLEANEIFKRTDPSIVVLKVVSNNGKELLGSGVIVAPRDVVTNCHVLMGASSIAVKQGDVQRSARLRFQDTARDLCQVQLDDSFPAGKPVSRFVLSADLEVGQPVFAIGAPRGLEHTLSRGIVSALRGAKDNAKLIQTDAAVTHGSSGGGLFDSDARLVGIITFGIGEGNLNFAIPADWVQDLANRNRDRLADAPQSNVAGATSENSGAATTESGLLRSGDRWKYRIIYGKQDVGTVNVEIIEVHAKTATERITYDRSKGFTKERQVEVGFNPARFQPLAALPGGYQMMDLAPYANPDTDFKTGQSWDDVPGDFAPQGGSNTQKAISRVAIVGRETVRVPAGEFKAWKIESVSENIYALNQFFVAKCTYWYAPEMKRTVKMILYYKSPTDAISSSQTYELLSFEPGN